MPLLLNIEGTSAESRIVQARDGSYDVQIDGIAAIPLFCPLNLAQDLDPTGYQVHILFAGDVRESDIYQVHVTGSDGDARIGWFIPLLSLESDLHDFSDNPHFLRYARAAVESFLDAFPQGAIDHAQPVSIDNCLTLSTIAPESTVLIVVSKKVIADGVHFDINRLYPFLSSIGVLDENQSKGGRVVVPFARPTGPKLRCVHCAEEFSRDKLVTTLFTYAAHAFRNPVLQFFYLYQVIELLMERIFTREQTAIVAKINAANGSVIKVKEAIDDLGDCLSEKRRISAIIDKYCEPRPDLSNLVRACRDLNSALDIKNGDTLAKSLYPLRNMVFHNYRAFPDDSLADLGRINSIFFSSIPLVLESFRYPEGG